MGEVWMWDKYGILDIFIFTNRSETLPQQKLYWISCKYNSEIDLLLRGSYTRLLCTPIKWLAEITISHIHLFTPSPPFPLDLCLSVPKDLANCWTDIVLLYNVASNRSYEGFINVIAVETTTHPREITTRIKWPLWKHLGA